MKSKKQVIPKWFDGTVYEEGTEVRNPFSGEKYKLNAVELSIYDFIIGATMYVERAFVEENFPLEPSDKAKELTKDLRKGLDWFRENNPKAYMVLLD